MTTMMMNLVVEKLRADRFRDWELGVPFLVG